MSITLLLVTLTVALTVGCELPLQEAPAQGDPRPTCDGGNCLSFDGGAPVTQADAAQVGSDAAADAGTRSALCGEGCDPDPKSNGDQALCMKEGSGATRLYPTESPSSPATNGPVGSAGLPNSLPHRPPASPASEPPQTRACRVSLGDGGVEARCAPAGAGVNGASCTSSGDCAPGYTCVRSEASDSPTAGQCRAFCCSGTGCDEGTYCSQRKLFEPGMAPTRGVPVCAPADGCKLLDPAACEPGFSCVVVQGGATTCFLTSQSDGREGERCPCAADHICSSQTNTCRKICHLGSADECGKGSCVGGSATFPEGFGVCAAP